MARAGTAGEVAGAFLRLGLTSFGGPIAHLGYFRREFVERRAWLDDARFAQLLAVCHFLPGPASSQLGFAIGLLRAGWAGALAAFAAFTLPSALLLFLLARAGDLLRADGGRAVAHGLELVAVAVVADGVWRMARRMARDVPRGAIAAAAAAGCLLLGGTVAQLGVIAGGALLGLLLLRDRPAETAATFDLPYGRRTAWIAAGLALAGLAAALAAAGTAPSLARLGAAFYRAGALVFGGGHVVLPLLEQALVAPGWIDAETFLAGYGAAQAIPGPMFSLSAYLGAQAAGAAGSAPAAGALVALAALFLPGFLLLIAALPLWRRLHDAPGARHAVGGVNAAVVGILAAALWDPVIAAGIARPLDVLIVVPAIVALARFERATLGVVGWCVSLALLGR